MIFCLRNVLPRKLRPHEGRVFCGKKVKTLKKGKDLVIDLDSVEYLMRDEAVVAFEREDKNIPLLQLFDGLVYMIPIEEIKSSLREKGIIDYLDKRI